MNAIVYLVDTEDAEFFRNSLASLHHIKFENPCQILVFHEPSFPKDVIAECQLRHQARFIELEFKLPNYPPEVSIPEFFTGPNGCQFSIGYRHMCRFFSGELFKREELNPYRYILRLDADSSILESIDDPFERMIEERAAYGFRMINWDDPTCYVNFYETFQLACKSIGLDTIPKRDGKVYYTNFEVLDLDCFRAPEYLKVYEFMDRTAGFFVHRWGDHILRYNYLSAFGKKAIKFNFAYIHANTLWPRDSKV